ncbi:hypothetical protein JCGZ_19536 [Jatropha curcas]|uniref:Uncharacterized protein n=1 Tax=Jatropha curcas TaxID=180498 RepID=A0A067JYM6_JATCU|nr:hypothetical protein JCGZ_19536 [Jatropha curcas]
MTSSDLSGEDFLESLGISLDDVDLTTDADTYASVTGIFAQSLENMAHLAEYDWAGAILSRMYDDMSDLSRGHCKLSGTYYFWEVEVGAMTAGLQSWIQVDSHFQRAPRAISEASGPVHPDLANLRLPYSIPYYPPDGPPALWEVSLESVDRPALPSEDITEVPVGLVNQMIELMLGMQQELTAAGLIGPLTIRGGGGPVADSC